jgi:tRNA modification GTPase
VNKHQYNPDDTICALATAAGVGAIGVIRISGKEALAISSRCFKGKNLQEVPTHTAHFGKFMQGPDIIDEILATVFVAPKSYTGEHTVELSCHGSPYIQQKILETLVENGARLAQPGEFTLRAFLNRKLDLTQAEAVADLIASDSAMSHKTAMNQMRGGFSKEIAVLREKLINFASLIELELDFSEEDVEFASRPELHALVSNLHQMMLRLSESFKTGNAIKNGVPTVIAGKPNAGKSTLLNALIKEDRAIVSDIAGTTRDTIEEVFTIGGINYRLIDTAGIRSHTADVIESIGIEKTYEKIRLASIVIYLFDALSTSEAELQQSLQEFENLEAVVIAVANKIDLADLSALQEKFKAFENLIFLSSKTQDGLNQLYERLRAVVETDKVNNDVIITNIRHYRALQEAAQSLEQVLESMQMNRTGELLAFDIRKSIYHLGEITGDISTDDLLANIFSKFCIGK